MPLQQTLQSFPVGLQPGHYATTQSQFRFNFQAYCDLTNLAAIDQVYGTLVVRQADGTYAVPTVATIATGQMGIVTYDYRLISKQAYKPNELLNLEMVGDRWVRCIPGIVIKAGDPIFVYVAGANAGIFSNVLDGVAANTRKIQGMWLDDKIAADLFAPIVFNLFAPAI